MSQTTFLAALKSTLDKIGYTLAVEQGLTYVDLDDSTATAEAFKSDSSNIVLEYNTLDTTQDPLYTGFLQIGARTTGDPANYEILKLMGLVGALFIVGQRIEIRAAFEATEGPLEGVLIPTKTGIQTQQYELVSGIRLLGVEFSAQRFLS